MSLKFLILVIGFEISLVQLCSVHEVRQPLSPRKHRICQVANCNHRSQLGYNFIKESKHEFYYAICDILPLNLSMPLKYATFENSTIPVLPAEAFSKVKVSELYLNSSKIRSLTAGCFSKMSNLSKLYLENNNISIIPKGTFRNLTGLKILSLANNHLSMLEEPFSDLISLEELYLNHNRLTKLANFPSSNLKILNVDQNELQEAPSFLHSLPSQLKFLHLSHNRLQNFDFENLPEVPLEEVHLDHNQLTRVLNWHKLKNVDEVDLCCNFITQIEPIGPNVTHLSLEMNHLEWLGPQVFANSTNLTTIDLSGNLMKGYDVGTFRGLSRLKYLYLEDNNLSELPIGGFRSLLALEHLWLSNNSLTSLKFGTFAGLGRLEELRLDHNQLKVIPERSFHVFASLKILNLNGNQLASLDVDKLLNEMKLDEIWLGRNNLTCEALHQMKTICEERKVKFRSGDEFDVANYHGIPCMHEGEVFGKQNQEEERFYNFLMEGFRRFSQKRDASSSDLLESRSSKYSDEKFNDEGVEGDFDEKKLQIIDFRDNYSVFNDKLAIYMILNVVLIIAIVAVFSGILYKISLRKNVIQTKM